MDNIRNFCIIAHIDHGKSTLADRILEMTGTVEKRKMKEQLLDQMDLERERGITIVSKNVSIRYKDYKINIIDTPGHSDFGGEVERVLNMADGCLLLVDAFEGPMPQTRFVLQKALQIGLKPIVVVNKVDKPNCRPDEVQEAVFDLMCNLDATEDQLNFPTVYGSAKNNWMSDDWRKPRENDITPVLDAIIKFIPAPPENAGTVQMLITSLIYSSFVGRIAVGRIHRGTLKNNQTIALSKRDGSIQKCKIKELRTFEGFGQQKADEVNCGEICAIVGLDDFEIGDCVCDVENPEALPPTAIDEPTMSMEFLINNSPFFGREGKFVTSRHIDERLNHELEKDVALRVEKGVADGHWTVFGRGVLHLSVLIETMRREGYELQVGQPKVIIKEIDGVKCEPFEELTIDTPDSVSGKVIEMVTVRKGEMTNMERKGERVHLDFKIPSRGIIGLRTNVLTATAGEAVIAHRFIDYEPYKGPMERRNNGSIIAMESGTSFAYALNNLQDRGKFFINPGDEIYAGQVVGENNKNDDLVVNVTKSKKLTNMRASGSDDKVKIAPPIIFSLEEALEYIREDEYVEVTPTSMRMRKIILDEGERKKCAKKVTTDI